MATFKVDVRRQVTTTTKTVATVNVPDFITEPGTRKEYAEQYIMAHPEEFEWKNYGECTTVKVQQDLFLSEEQLDPNNLFMDGDE